MKATRILVIEDEAAIRDMIRFALAQTSFVMEEAENTIQAERMLADSIPNIILLDWMLPGKSGIDFIRWLKQQNLYRDIPIIMLTAKAEEENKVKGLETGADDYITKPFSPKELIARIKTILRRGIQTTPEGIIQFKELYIQPDNQQVTINNQKVKLTPVEYRLLHFFLMHQNRVYSRDQLLSFIWGTQTYIDDRTVDVQIQRLRNRLKPYAYDIYLQTVRSSGYLFSSDNT